VARLPIHSSISIIFILARIPRDVLAMSKLLDLVILVTLGAAGHVVDHRPIHVMWLGIDNVLFLHELC